MHRVIRVAGRFTRIWEFRSSPTISEPQLRVLGQGQSLWRTPLFRQLGRCRGLTMVVRRASQARPESSGQSRPPQNDLTNLAWYCSSRHLSDTMTEVFPWIASVVRWIPGYIMQRRGKAHTPHPPPPSTGISQMRLSTVVCFRLATAPIWAQNPDSHPTKVYPSKSVNSRAAWAAVFGMP